MPLILPAPWKKRASTPPRISIIIPVYGNSSLTDQCIKAILATPHPDTLEIIVVDDGSPSPIALDNLNNPFVRVVRREANARFAAACNYGAQVSFPSDPVWSSR